MQTLKIITLKMLLNISLIVIVLSGCAQSGNETKEKSAVEPPQMEIQAAVMSGNLEVIKQHIAAGTDLNEKDAMSGSTPLISAVTFDKIEITKALIDGGADLNKKNNDGATPLHAAAFFCRVEIVQMLIDAKADKTLRNNFGATARESVIGPFAGVKPVYEMMQLQLSSLGLQLDMDELEKTRPVIAMMLQ